jgi:hypothetical protein
VSRALTQADVRWRMKLFNSSAAPFLIASYSEDATNYLKEY